MTRNKIIEQSKSAFAEALFCLLKNEDFENITIKQLTLESGYSRRTYYRYFGSKTAILDEMFLKYLHSYRECLLSTPIRPEDISKRFINFLWPYHQRVALLAQQNLLIPLLTRHISTIANTLLDIKVPWRQKKSDNRQYYYVIIYSIGGFCVLLDTIFKDDLPEKPQQISEALNSALAEIALQVNKQ
ncbi:TetR/AcrR family transcriptional regulator [Liquorilactobacillus mali]|uniref:Transcription regulator n=1 Tax=Liquorilactobacillus mali KCTC 3596 = DSM 20444 TaxID=1046596 RepID=A0A0R2E5U8_9LACO|nr:TetR/AcrR family transcriptional regulator [Liquorilactobacillus mali]KRN11059.1 transcription regulator [Liquorilactobacillus mali KCTC 3596 = DSM 20444]MDC7953827.1 TetR/AcrR family transcriptional regulator [Liquorilactobacillus mali]QFQ75554.1 TetR/AcrR family transcriptional regulator [Liquorilactobacillus mali]